MSRENGLIDLTESLDFSPKPSAWRERGRSATIDLSCPHESHVDAVDLGRPARVDEAGPSHYMQPAVLQDAETSGAGADTQLDVADTGKSIGKRKRVSQAERARQAEVRKQETQARRAEAKAQKEQASANKNARVAAEKKEKQVLQKRIDQYGKTVRYSSTAPQQTKDRMARAMPSMLLTPTYC